jgi:cobalt/nickel transport system permease protein
MHLGNGAIAPECAALGVAAAAVGIGWSVQRLASRKERIDLAHAAALGSLVFAAQMFNVPVLSMCSVHFVGGVLLAELLGPAAGVLTMSAVLLLQAILLGDGGLSALGVNIANMALAPAGSLLLMRRLTGRRHAALAGASGLAIGFSVLLILGEVALGRTPAELANWTTFVSAMLTNHLPLLALEGAVTVALVALWRHAEREKVDQRSTWRLAATAGAMALLVGLVAAAASSSLPDGYQSAAKMSQMIVID